MRRDDEERDIPVDGILPSTLAEAALPRAYERAKAGLSRCERVDECKDWGDRALALASYARQAQDDDLESMARRIRNRAIRRMGEVLERIEPDKPGPKAEIRADGRPYLSPRRQAAEDAGVSEPQQKIAQRVARVPEAEFEAAVERDRPATVGELANMGTRSVQTRSIDEAQRAKRLLRGLEGAAELGEAMGDLEHLSDIQRGRAAIAAAAMMDVAKAVILFTGGADG